MNSDGILINTFNPANPMLDARENASGSAVQLLHTMLMKGAIGFRERYVKLHLEPKPFRELALSRVGYGFLRWRAITAEGRPPGGEEACLRVV